jgi:hypothetical protein
MILKGFGNATKPNPFKIILLQPTRKENNWETEETMERATVTLETERAKWPNLDVCDDNDLTLLYIVINRYLRQYIFLCLPLYVL